MGSSMESFNYPVVGLVKSENTGEIYQILDIPMMSDEKWKEMTNTPEQIERRKIIARLGEAGAVRYRNRQYGFCL